MSYTYTVNETETFSLTHAKKIASKVATDLMRFMRLYGLPTETQINRYEAELIEYLNAGYLESVTYGFWRGGRWTEAALKYRALPNGTLASDDDPGRIRPGFDVSNATFYSFLISNDAYAKISATEEQAFLGRLPFRRGAGQEPALEVGQWANDLNYSAGGRSFGRQYVQR